MCKIPGHPIANFDNRPYKRPMITVPDTTFPNRRNESENGTAISPIKLIGNKIGSGLKQSGECSDLVVTNAGYTDQYKRYHTKWKCYTVIRCRWTKSKKP